MNRRARTCGREAARAGVCGEYSAPAKEFNSDLWSQRPEKNWYPAEFSGAFLDAMALEKAVSYPLPKPFAHGLRHMKLCPERCRKPLTTEGNPFGPGHTSRPIGLSRLPASVRLRRSARAESFSNETPPRWKQCFLGFSPFGTRWRALTTPA